MKPNPLKMALTALALIACPGLSAVAESARDGIPARVYAVSEIVAQGDGVVCLGKHRSVIIRRLGYPSVKLSNDVWAYHCRFRPASDEAMRDGCCSLLVQFTDGRVSEVYFANRKACEIVQARLDDPRRSRQAVLATVSAPPRAQAGMQLSRSDR